MLIVKVEIERDMKMNKMIKVVASSMVTGVVFMSMTTALYADPNIRGENNRGVWSTKSSKND